MCDLANYGMYLETQSIDKVKDEAEEYAMKRRIVAVMHKMPLTDYQCQCLMAQKNLLNKLYSACKMCDSYFDVVTRDALHCGIAAFSKCVNISGPNEK